MAFKMSEEKRRYHREYLRKKYASDPEYRAKVKAKTKERQKAGYFSIKQKEKRAAGGDELRAKEAAYMRERRAADPEHHRKISNRCKAKARKERPHLHRNQWLKWAYGMTLEEYEGKLAAQGGVCLTCGGNNGGKPLVVDHDHNKPKGEGNRGLLCNGCNVAIGAVLENPNVLRKIADMLEGYSGARHSC